MSYLSSRLGHLRDASRSLSVAFTLLAASGCVFTEPADNYPFLPALTFDDRDLGVDNNLVKDIPQAEPPLLIFTELLIDAPGMDPTVNERGEYIEVKNVGEGPADPRAITMFVGDLDNPLARARISVQPPFGPDEEAIVNGLQMILPGEYFIFIRYEDPAVAAISDQLRAGYVYDYGLYGNGPTLPHQQGVRRQLDLGYSFPGGETAIFDTIRWEAHELLDPDGGEGRASFSEGKAIAVDAAFEAAEDNDSPENWCTLPNLVGEVSGTPGGPASCG